MILSIEALLAVIALSMFAGWILTMVYIILRHNREMKSFNKEIDEIMQKGAKRRAKYNLIKNK
jgi:uncharacterized membrane protein (DUF485 family)